MVALFFNFSKRINSTKTPDDSTGTELHISIRGNIPSGQLSSQSGTEYFDSHPTVWVSGNNHYNYVKLGGRYYFVRDRQREINDATVYYLEEDYLATFKSAILATTAKVIYSSSDYDLNIDDIRNQETESTSLAYNVASFPFAYGYDTGGTFLVTIAGGSLVATTYVFTPDLLKNFVDQYIYTGLCDQNDDIVSQSINTRNQNLLTIKTDILNSQIDAMQGIACMFAEWANNTSTGVVNQLGGVFDSIKDIKWSPFQYTEHCVPDGGAYKLTPMCMGTVQTGQLELYAYGGNIVMNTEITIPHQGNNYQKDKRFSSYGIYIPFCGQYALSNDDIYGVDKLYIDMGMDRQTGSLAGVIKAGSNNGKRILSFAGETAKSQIHALADNATMLSMVKNTATGIIDTVTGALTGGVAGALTHGAKSVSRLISGVDQTNIISGGALSSAIGIASGHQIVCFSTMKGMADSQTAIKDIEGLPCHKTVQLSTLTGYCLCDHASVPMEGTYTEKQYVNSALNSGFYIE